MSLKDGQKPLSSKPKTPAVSEGYDDLFGNALTINATLQAELDKKGLKARFVDYKQMKEMDGYHKKGWVIYKRDDHDILDSKDFRFGQNPNGYVRRGTLVLAVKPKEAWLKHKRYLERKAQTYSTQAIRAKADQLRQQAREVGSEAKIHEGYEDN